MSQVDISANNHILHVHLTRPEKYNALSIEMYDAMSRALHRLATEDELRVAVISAEGKHFTAGIELDQWAPLFERGEDWPLPENAIDPMGVNSPPPAKPVIMAAQGYCFTWGVEVMLNTDIRVASRNTQFQMLEVQRGLFPCGGATFRLPEEIGWGNAQRVLLTGERWSAEQALHWGMIQELTEDGEQIERAMELAASVARAAPLAVQALLRASRYARENSSREDRARQIFRDLAPIMRSEDAHEGIQSFVERREARFTGR